MTQSLLEQDIPLPGPDADLETVLAAWHGATLRLEKTHEILRTEVRRLTDELERKNRELARKNRLADLGQMASHVAHEVRNNLVPVTLYLSLLRRRIADDPGSLEVLDKITAGFTELDATVNDLLQFTSDRDPCLQPVALRGLVDEVLGSVAPQLAAQSIGTTVDMPDSLTLLADAHMLRRAMLNLVLNAVDAMPDGGTLSIAAADDHSQITLRVADSGDGLDDEMRQRIFEPFFSTKECGTGLGLAIVSRIAEGHGGSITADNRPEGGAVLTLHLPRLCRKEMAA